MKVTILSDKDSITESGYSVHSLEFSVRWLEEDLESADWEYPRFTDSARSVLAEFLAVRSGWRRVKGYHHVIPELRTMFTKTVDEQVVMVEE